MSLSWSPAASLHILLLLALLATGGSGSCKYRGRSFLSGDPVPTGESCLSCSCKGAVVVCKLRVCPGLPDPPPPGCILLQRKANCCHQLICYDNPLRKLLGGREQRLEEEGKNKGPSGGKEGSCRHEGTLYAEGSAMRSSTLCQHCFCIRGEMKCSAPKCMEPPPGCSPIFRSSHSCCPTNYDCSASSSTTISTGGTPNQPTNFSLPIPGLGRGCRLEGGVVIPEGEPILPLQLGGRDDLCQSCFCMGGVVRCSPLSCDAPIPGCRGVKEEGHCCPDRYECEEAEATTPSPSSSEGEREEGETAPTTAPTTTSTQVYELRFQRIPLLRAEGEEEEGRAFAGEEEGLVTETEKEEDEETTTPTSLQQEEPTASSEQLKNTNIAPNSKNSSSSSDETMNSLPLLTLTDDLRLEPVSTSHAPNTTLSTNPTTTPTPASTTTTTTATSSSKLEFISFGMEDAMPSYEVVQQKEAEGVEEKKGGDGGIRIMTLPPQGHAPITAAPPLIPSPQEGKSSSLYSHGFFGSSGGGGGGGSMELFVREGEELEGGGGGEKGRIWSRFGLEDSAPRKVAPLQPIHHPPQEPPSSAELFESYEEEDLTAPFLSAPEISVSDTKVALSSSPKNKGGGGGGEGVVVEVKSRPLVKSTRRKEGEGLFPFTSGSSLGGLKLSGCNIYGRLHGVGGVVPELSSPCVECRCTELGVQCSQRPC